MQSLLYALVFLTRLPLVARGLRANTDAVTQARSLLWYPAVGLLLAALLYSTSVLLPVDNAPLLSAVVLIALLSALTGALHLDGLADCSDAWVGGGGNRERSLEIMKDPSAGPVAVVVLLITLLLKITSLAVLLQISADIAGLGLATALVLSRSAVLLLFLSSHYVSPQGLGSTLASHLPRIPAALIFAVSLAVIGWLDIAAQTALLALLALAFWLWRQAWQQRIGGFNGDCAGALIEIIETLVLLFLALRLSYA